MERTNKTGNCYFDIFEVHQFYRRPGDIARCMHAYICIKYNFVDKHRNIYIYVPIRICIPARAKL